jgi:hypothetical protein
MSNGMKRSRCICKGRVGFCVRFVHPVARHCLGAVNRRRHAVNG